MRKRYFTGILVGFCVLAIMGFGSFALAKEFKWPPLIRITTAGSQTASFASSNGWGAKFSESMGVQVRVVPEDSEVRRYVRFTEGKEFELNSVTDAVSTMAIEGGIGFADKRAYPFRTVWYHNDTPWGFVVRGDSNIKNVQDLKRKGLRVSVAIGQAVMITAIKEALPAFIGWTPEEAEKNWTFIPASSYAENCRNVTDGKADLAYMSPISAVAYEMEAHPAKIRWINLPVEDKEAWKRFIQIRPTVIPTNMNIGVPSAIGVGALTSTFLYAVRTDMDEEMAYRLAKWLHLNYDNYKDTHAIAQRMSLKQFREYLNYTSLPVADGTIRYLKEIGQWTAADDKWNNEAIALMDRWIKVRNAALDEAKAKGVKIHWENKEYLAILEKHTKGIPVFMTRLD